MFSFLLGLAAAQAAQLPPPPAPEPDVVVKGRAEAERRREADIFVRRVAPVPRHGQIARWQYGFCPGVAGTEEEFASHVVARVRAVARQVGAPVDREGCSPNAMIVFVPDAPEMMREIERRAPWLLRGVPVADRQTLRTSRAPALWWASSQVEGADGDQAQMSSLGSVAEIRHYRSSLIAAVTRVAYTGAVVLVGLERSNGLKLDTLADYATFVLLSDARPGRAPVSTTSILDLYDIQGPGRPAALTSYDRFYLSSLYKTPADRPAMVQKRAIGNRMTREIGRIAYAEPK